MRRGRIEEAVERLEKAAEIMKSVDERLEILEITLRLPPDVSERLFAKCPKILQEQSVPVDVITRKDAKREKQKAESLKEAEEEIAAAITSSSV